MFTPTSSAGPRTTEVVHLLVGAIGLVAAIAGPVHAINGGRARAVVHVPVRPS